MWLKILLYVCIDEELSNLTLTPTCEAALILSRKTEGQKPTEAIDECLPDNVDYTKQVDAGFSSVSLADLVQHQHLINVHQTKSQWQIQKRSLSN